MQTAPVLAASAALRRAEPRSKAPASIRKKASGLKRPSRWVFRASAEALSSEALSEFSRSRTSLRPPIMEMADNSSAKRAPSLSRSFSVSRATSKGSSTRGTSLAASVSARSRMPPRSRPQITAAHMSLGGWLRKRSTSGRLDRII